MERYSDGQHRDDGIAAPNNGMRTRRSHDPAVRPRSGRVNVVPPSDPCADISTERSDYGEE